jgi:hypothetical protein
MAENSSGGGLINVVAAGIGSIYIIRLIQRLRRRATNPNIADPGRRYIKWLPWIPAALIAVLAAVVIALFAIVDPLFAVVLSMVIALLLAVVGLVAIAGTLATAEDQRRAQGYVVCEDDYADAPRQIKATMRRIYRSARTIRSGHANQRNMFGDLGLEQVVYSAAERAIVASNLAAAVRDLKPEAKASDRKLLDDANSKIRAIRDELTAVEATLKRATGAAEALSASVTEPERKREAAQAKAEVTAAAEDRAERARTRLIDATLRADATPEFGHADLEDRVTAVAAGYAEVKNISDATLDEPQLPSQFASRESGSASVQSDRTARDQMLRTAKFVGGHEKLPTGGHESAH